MSDNKLKSLLTLPVIVAALGYFVDIYDLLLFSIVRQSSLMSMGVPEAKLLETGEFLLRIQMGGLLLGGLLWGIMGDKRGRLSVLFGSILLYSLANIANGFATTVEQYAWLRFIAGIGLAGELGAGITLVSETLPKEKRGYGTTIVAAFGLMGAVLANFVSRITHPHWEIAYFIGGGLGLLLLIARVSILESGIFLKTKDKKVERGNVSALFSNSSRFKRLVGCIFIGLPIWYAIGILITFSPEFARALGIAETAKAGDAVMISYIGLAVGDIISGLSSQWFRTRKKVVMIFIFLTLGMVLLFLFPPVKTLYFFYFTCFMLGVSIGYWALFVTIAAEQFGTNLRSTVATSVPNFIRGTVIPLTLFFKYLRLQFGDGTPNNPQGVIFGALAVGIITIVIALMALRAIDETFGRDLNYEETD